MGTGTRAGRWGGIARAAGGACALALALALGGCALTTPSRSDVAAPEAQATIDASALMEAGVLTVAVDTSDAPQAMNGNDGAPTGYYVDVARALAQHFGLNVKIVSAASAHSALDSDEADLYIGSKPSDASSTVTVLGTVGEDASAVFVKASDSSSTPSVSASSLEGATIGVQSSSASQDALKRAGISATQKTYENVNKCFDALDAGEVSYVACDATAGGYLARAYPDIVFAGTIGSTSSYGIGVLKANDELADAIKQACSDLADNGVFDALHTAWYGNVPLSLTDTTVDGVTVAQSSGNGSEESGTADGDRAVETDTPITRDINSLG